MILKCKMCGGDLVLGREQAVVECEYCGTMQTVPSADNEKKANLFNRANRLRMSAEFDKAASVYESIVAEFPEEAEAYWGLCLCAYGIEYVDDPATGKKIPTCHRTRAESVMESNNFEMACEYADVVAKRMYRSEAREIDRLQKEILAIVANESPYDVFICYKETAEDGGRTEDSVIAQDMYDALTAKGLKVFFARITLEDKLGQQYEPYIYAALHSAKVMLAIGTCYEHFDAVWVKNEWSRFLDMMKEDRTKVLVPCFKGVDAYDIPKEMRSLQAQDMGKLGFMQDLVRGVEKIVGKMPAVQPTVQPVQQVVQQTVVQQQGVGVDSLMRRAQLFLEDGDWKSANEYLNKVLDINPEHAPAYFGKVMARYQIRKEEQFKNSDKIRESQFENDADWKKAVRFADAAQKKVYEGYQAFVQQRRDEIAENERKAKEEKRIKQILGSAQENIETAESVDKCLRVKEILGKIKQDPRAQKIMDECDAKIEKIKSDTYDSAFKRMQTASRSVDFYEAEQKFVSLGSYRNSAQLAKECVEKEKELSKIENERAEAERKAEEERREQQRLIHERNMRIAAAKEKKRNIVIAVCAAIAAAAVAAYVFVLEPMSHYNKAQELMASGQYSEASAEFEAAGAYKDAADRVGEPYYVQAEALMAEGKLDEAAACFEKAGIYTDAAQRAGELYYVQAETLMAEGKYEEASASFEKAGTYSDAAQRVGEPYYVQAKHFEEQGEMLYAVLMYRKSGKTQGLQHANDLMMTERIDAGDHVVGVKSDGTVVAAGNNYNGECKVGDWRDIVAASAGLGHTVALKSDGTVVAAGIEGIGQYRISNWRDIVAVSAGSSYTKSGDHTVALKADGTVVAVGNNDDGQCNVSNWRDIVAVSAGDEYTVALKSDGTVVAKGNNYSGKCEVGDWRDVVEVSAGGNHTVALKSDGTVVATGQNYYGQCKVGDWKDIVAVSAGEYHTVALKADGTVVATGENNNGRCDVGDWRDIVAVSAGSTSTVGLKSDGTVVSTKSDLSRWNLL